MPQKDFKDMPNSPYAVIQGKYRDAKLLLGKQFQQDEYALQSQRLTDKEYEVKNIELNAHYNKLLSAQTVEHRGRIGELDRIKASHGRGEMSSDAAYQAGWKMVLPSETFNARFPKPDRTGQAKPMSAASIKSAGFMMGELIASAVDKRGLEWGKPRKVQSSLIEKYVDWRAQSGYEEYDPMHQNQLDLRWDAIMRSDKVYRDWFADKGKRKVIAEVRSLRSKGRLGKAMSKKFVPDQVKRTDVSPIGSSFIDQMGESTKKHLPKEQKSAPTAEELRGKGTEDAYNRGVTLGYWK